MANLRTNNLSGEQGQNAYRGSVFFDGGSQLDVTSNSDFAVGTGAYTAEVWFHSGLNSGENSIFGTFTASNFGFGMWHNANNLYFEERQNAYSGDNPRITYDKFEEGYWYHLAMCRDSSSGTLRAYVNGVQIGSTTSNLRTIAGTAPTIGENGAASNQCKGYISNIRFSNTELYPSGTTFTPPTSELTADASTILLACQDSDNALQEATGKTITGIGRYADSSIELVTNPSFNNGTTGWTLSDANEGSMAVVNGQLVLTNDDSSDPPVYAWQAVTTVVGQRYELKVHFSGGTGTPGSNLAVYLNNSSSFGSNAGGQMTADSVSANGIKTMQFTATVSTTYVLARVNANASGTSIFSAVSIKAADYGDTPKVIPPYGVDAGNTFGGPIQQSSQGYMYFPSGRTEERGGTRACWFRGYDSPEGNKDVIDFTEMSSRGNAVHFGDALSSNRQAGALGSSTRGVFGGRDGSSNVIEFITFSTQSNSSDFGDFTVGRSGSPGTASNGTRGLFFGGYAPNLASANVIEFITIANLGNGTDFGDLTNAGSEAAGCASPTRAIRMGGRLTGNNPTDVIDFFTIQTVGNAQDFGDLTVGRSEAGGASSDTRGVCIAGYNYPGGGQNVIDFVTIASSGNATDFGDLAAYTDSWQGGSGSNNVIIAHGIGYNDSARDNRIDFITIATTGNSVDYGDLTDPRSQIPCATNGHGGLS